ncbi:MAG: hypothetical protein SAJ37_04830 [Oscillatoria sp. PMC 1068.18]|nr:hypothetical protein [Oscillatoria sp. PMC 1076.18]MEC4988054.1 hypothetical protein [Oscillatoria sp. PMC 1068.18]
MITSNHLQRGKLFSIFLLLVFLASCGKNSPNLEQPTGETSTPDVIENVDNIETESPATDNQQQSKNNSAKQTQSRNSVAPGTYCFEHQDETLTSEAELTVAANNQVTGNLTGTIQNEAEGYFTSYQQNITGNLQGNQLQVDLTTEIELDTQTSQETWQLTTSQLKTERTTYQAVDCAALNDVAATSSQRIQFAPGKSSAVVSNSVIRGERDVYLVKANSGQTMKLTISSLEDNAVFDLIAPGGKNLELGATNASVVLPVAGDYTVIVGGTRGNATYDLEVEIN